VETTAALTNKGHFGVPLRKGDDYVFRAMVQQRAGAPLAADLTMEVLDQFGAVALRASAKLQELGIGKEWREVILRGTASATTGDGELRVTLPGPATFALDTVTLMPAKTWKNHGLRMDLAEKLSLLKPAFVRFPGGCYVEGGDLLADRFQWKTSIGPIDARPGHRNANWGYWSSGLLGYHEYLQLCEDLSAAPMFVVNCGMSHKEVVPMDQLQPWIQDALDAIEYANGDASTPYGKLRAANGHPAPFGLRYLEIGNENGMFGSFGGTLEQYSERYEAFRAAIAAKWPDVLTIANTRVKHPMQIVDDHFYMSSGWFWAEADRYAKADRKGPKVYIGEYAVTHDPGKTGNLRAALGEAAFLFGCERNSDLVTMTSYAPLFVHVKDRKWNPDAIQFDGLRSCGTPSFWMQTMLAEHRPDTLLPTETPVFQQDLTRGSFGFGTWNTQAEYKDITVEHHGDVLYRSDFSKGAGGFRHEAGEWTVVDGALRQSAPGNMQWTWLPNPVLQALADCTIRCKARKISGDEGFLVMFHVAGAGDWTWFNVGGWGNTKHALERSTAGSKIGLGEQVLGKVETGKWHDLRVECKDGEIRCFLDDVLVLQTKDRNPPDFSAVAGSTKTGEIVLKVCNGSNVPRLTTIDLRGAGAMQSKAKGVVLTSASLDDENTVDAPRLVAPKPVEVGGVTNNFAYTFPARSLTVLRLLPN
jgi:alpha-L-arabinofuranosidase